MRSNPATRRARLAAQHAGGDPGSVSLPAAVRGSTTDPELGATAGHLGLWLAFSGTVARYLRLVLPQASSDLAHWRSRASEIPNPKLRLLALEALGKRGNVEGAALFATLAPATYRRDTVRALVAFQTAYNYLDGLSEQPSADPVANGGGCVRMESAGRCRKYLDFGSAPTSRR